MRKAFVLAWLLMAAPVLAQVPNDRAVVEALFATGRYTLTTHDGQAVFVDDAVAALHAKDPKWGHLRKRPGQTNIHLHAEDAALYLSDVPGQSTAVDFIGGAGGPTPSITWGLDQPRYSPSDWWNPVEHTGPPPPVCPICPTCPICKPTPPYAGDEVFDRIAVSLFADYAEAGQAPNEGMGRWFGRVVYDWIAGVTKTLDESIAKHRKEWREILGLP